MQYISLNKALNLSLSVEMFKTPFVTAFTENFALTLLPWKPLRGKAKDSQGLDHLGLKQQVNPHKTVQTKHLQT